MKRAVKVCGAILAAVMMIPSIMVNAAADGEETYTVTSDDVRLEDGEYKVDYEDEIEVDGVIYKYDHVTFTEDKLQKKSLSEDSEIQFIETIVNDDGTETTTEPKEVTFPETKVVDGVTYILSETKTEEKIKEGRTVETTVIEKRNETKNGPAKTEIAAVDYTDPDTGTKKKMPEGDVQMLPFVSSELKSESWGNGDFHGDMQFKDYQYRSFVFQGVTIEKNDARPMPAELYPLVLNYLNLDASRFRVTDVRWAGDAFTQNGTMYRNAEVIGDVFNREFEDTFTGIVTIPDIAYTYTTATYVESDEDLFNRSNVVATLTYVKSGEVETEPAETLEPETPEEPEVPARNPFIEFITSTAGHVTIGIVAGAAALVTIILVIAGRKKKKENSVK